MHKMACTTSAQITIVSKISALYLLRRLKNRRDKFLSTAAATPRDRRNLFFALIMFFSVPLHLPESHLPESDLPVHFCPNHICLHHICPNHNCLHHICPKHNCPSHICLNHICLHHISPNQSYPNY
jgi:hypothetical protein